VPVQWTTIPDPEATITATTTTMTALVSVHQIQHEEEPVTQVEPFLQTVPASRDDQKLWARRAMIASLESAGKQLCHTGIKLDTKALTAYWPEEGEWYDAQPLDPDLIGLPILASHAQFTLPGKYCPVAYEDGEVALTPLHYVRGNQRSRNV
jgi:hypothetical protein